MDQLVRSETPMPAVPRVQVFDDCCLLSQAAAKLVLASAGEALGARGRFTIGSGDAAAARVLSTIGRDQLEWHRVHIFDSGSRWGSGQVEAQSRSRDAPIELPIPAANLHAVPADRFDPNSAASAYEQQVRAFFGVAAGEIPRFDLMLLQLGADGHAALLFPGSSSLDETARLAVADYVVSLGANCVTLTLPLINHARTVLLVACGAAAAGALRELMMPDPGGRRVPAQLLRPTQGRLHIFADVAAASGLCANGAERARLKPAEAATYLNLDLDRRTR
jgi:6-phosphogluconolactonase